MSLKLNLLIIPFILASSMCFAANPAIVKASTSIAKSACTCVNQLKYYNKEFMPGLMSSCLLDSQLEWDKSNLGPNDLPKSSSLKGELLNATMFSAALQCPSKVADFKNSTRDNDFDGYLVGEYLDIVEKGMTHEITFQDVCGKKHNLIKIRNRFVENLLKDGTDSLGISFAELMFKELENPNQLFYKNVLAESLEGKKSIKLMVGSYDVDSSEYVTQSDTLVLINKHEEFASAQKKRCKSK